jgi:hypothetical protein
MRSTSGIYIIPADSKLSRGVPSPALFWHMIHEIVPYLELCLEFQR